MNCRMKKMQTAMKCSLIWAAHLSLPMFQQHTTVTTTLGVKTNFDALSEGDIIKRSVTKSDDGDEIVTEVWIMEQ